MKKALACTLAASFLLSTAAMGLTASAADKEILVAKPVVSYDYSQAGNYQKPNTQGAVSVDDGRLKLAATATESAFTTSFVEKDVSTFTMVFDYTPEETVNNVDTIVFDSWDGGTWDSYSLVIQGSSEANGNKLLLNKTVANVTAELASWEHPAFESGTAYRFQIVRNLAAGTIEVYFGKKADGLSAQPVLSVKNEKPVIQGQNVTHYRGKIWMIKWAGTAYLDNVAVYDTTRIAFDTAGRAVLTPVATDDFAAAGDYQKAGTENDGTVTVEDGKLKLSATASSSAFTSSFVENDVTSFVMEFDYIPGSVGWNIDTIRFDSWDGADYDSYYVDIYGSQGDNGNTIKLYKKAGGGTPAVLATAEHDPLVAGTVYRVRIARDLAAGTIDVYFGEKANGLGAAPVLSAKGEGPVIQGENITHYRGKIWMTKWDGTAHIDNLAVYDTSNTAIVQVEEGGATEPAGTTTTTTQEPTEKVTTTTVKKVTKLVDWDFGDTSKPFPFTVGSKIMMKYDNGALLVSTNGNNSMRSSGLTGKGNLGDFYLQMDYKPNLTEWNVDSIQFHSPDDVNNGITLQFLGYGAAALDDPNLDPGKNHHNVQLIQTVNGVKTSLGTAQLDGFDSGKNFTIRLIVEGRSVKAYIWEAGQSAPSSPLVQGTISADAPATGDIYLGAWASEFHLDNVVIFDSAHPEGNGGSGSGSPGTGVGFLAGGALLLVVASLAVLTGTRRKKEA